MRERDRLAERERERMTINELLGSKKISTFRS